MALVTTTLLLNGQGIPKCPRPPLDCGVDSKLILILTDPSLTANNSGVLVTDIISVTFDSSIFKYTYTVQFDDSLVTGPIVQADVRSWCCYTCEAEYAVDLAGQEIRIEDVGSDQFLVSQHGCRYQINAGSGPGNNGIPNSFLFGDGSFGDLTVPAGPEIVMPGQYNVFTYENITIDIGGILRNISLADTFGPTYQMTQVLVADTLTINGSLIANGSNAQNSTGSTSGNPGFDNAIQGAAGQSGGPGGYGGRGQTNAQTALPGEIKNYELVGTGTLVTTDAFSGGGIGGAGGNSGSGILGGVPTVPFEYYKYRAGRLHFKFEDIGTVVSSGFTGVDLVGVSGSSGGGGGGGGQKLGNSSGGAGGSGGGGADALYVCAKHIIINPGGVVSARGGNAGLAGNATLVDLAADGGGGGGGGGGGLVWLVYETLTNNGTIDVSGGTGSAGGLGVGGGINGLPGTDGTIGNIILYNLLTGEFE